MRIEVLYFDNCPSWEKGVENLRTALEAEDLSSTIDVEMHRVKNNREAEQIKFLGSPSFRLNGEELWPEERPAYTLSCRVYSTSSGLQGWPTVEMLREKLNNHLRKDTRRNI